MSYILDALKKADAERERRGVPSLSAQSATIADEERPRRSRAWGGIAALLAALALGAWWWSGRDTTPAPATVVAAAPVPPPVAAPRSDAATPSPATVVPPARAPVIVPPPTSERVPTLNELSADLRRQLPPLSVSGAVYAPQPSGRMVFINGQVLREGDAVAEGLVVERIGAKSSVLSLRGTRFELKH